MGQDFLFNNNYVEFRHPLRNRMKLHKTLQSHKLLTTLGFLKAVWAQTPLLVSRVCGDRGGCGLCKTWWLFAIHLKIRKDFLCAAKLEPTNRQATRPLFFFPCFGKGLYRWVWIWQSCHRFSVVVVCVCSISTLVSGNACSLQTYLLFYHNIYLSPTCRKLRFLWLVAPFFGVGFLQVRKSLETVSKAWLETCGFQLYQISQDLPAFAIIWAPSPSSIQFPLFHSSSPKMLG